LTVPTFWYYSVAVSLKKDGSGRVARALLDLAFPKSGEGFARDGRPMTWKEPQTLDLQERLASDRGRESRHLVKIAVLNCLGLGGEGGGRWGKC
jgi:hypothetical protein